MRPLRNTTSLRSSWARGGDLLPPLVLEAPTFPTGAGSISGILVDGETLTYTPASDSTGSPTPTRVVRWYNVADDSLAATGLTIVVAEGANLYVTEELSNPAGTVTANTPNTGVIAALPETSLNVNLDYSADSGVETLELSTLGPAPVGSTTYAGLASLPSGVTLTGSAVSVDMDSYVGGSFTVRRTDDNGGFDFVIAVTATDIVVTGSAGALSISYGLDTRDAFQVDVDIDGRAGSFTVGALNALSDGEAVNIVPPTAFIVTDADGDGLADVGDVVGRELEGLWAYPDTHTIIPTVVWQVTDNGTPVDSADSNLTVPDPSTGPFAVQETCGGVTVASSTTVAYGGSGTFDPASLFLPGDDGFLLDIGNSGTTLFVEHDVPATVATDGDLVGTARSNPPNVTARDFSANIASRRLDLTDAGGVVALSGSLVTDQTFETLSAPFPDPLAIFLAARCDGAGNVSRQMLFSAGNDASGLYLQTSGGSHFPAIFNTGFSNTLATTAVTDGTPFTACIDGAGATMSDGNFHLDGVSVGAYTNVRGLNDRILSRSEELNGVLSFVFARDRALTAGEIASLNSYAIAKVPTL